MAYHFKLESLLIFRRNLEEQAQLDLAREQRRLEEFVARLEELEAQRERLIGEFEERKKKRLAGALYSFYIEAIRLTDDRIASQRQTIATQQRRVEKSRQQLAERVKDRKVIEKARERDYQEYLREELKKRQNESDEQAVLRFGRNDGVG